MSLNYVVKKTCKKVDEILANLKKIERGEREDISLDDVL